MYDDIKINKRKTVGIVFLFLTFISLIVYFITYYFMDGSYFAIIIAMSFQ
jgi:hypothetical protein